MKKKTKTKEKVKVEAPQVEVPKVEPQNQAKMTSDGMVVGTTPATDPVPTVMVEATDVLEQAKKAIKEPVRVRINAMLGQQLFLVRGQLEKMVADGEIGSFLVLKGGQGFAGDYESNRVQLFTQAPGEQITDIQVG